MLVVDPTKRILIPEIRETPWFSKDLPKYLIPLPEKESVNEHEIIPSIVEEIEKKTGFSKSTIEHALSEVDNNQIKVAYQLVIDHRQMLTGGLEAVEMAKLLGGSPPAFSNTSSPSTRAPSESNSIQSSVKLLKTRNNGALVEASSDPRRTKVRSRWHYGIRSRSDPLDIMLEIYRAGKNVGMKWKTLDPYRIRCLYVTVRGLEVSLKLI